MACGNEHFSIIGPSHPNSLDWNNENHRRSVASCLVEGVYMLEVDRQKRRRGSQSLAPPWWESFHFRLIRPLVDDDGCSIFAAIFEHQTPDYAYYRTNNRGPRYVIAFRGSLFKPESFARDIKLDIEVILNGLHRTRSFAIAMEAVQDKVAAVGYSNLCLTGHSLGAAMAMLVGKTMAKEGKLLEALLFNPPYVSPPIERIKSKKVKQGINIVGTIIKAGLAFAGAANADHNQSKGNGYENSFAAISGWIPCLYVNQADLICCGYKGYFEHRKRMEDIGAGDIARVAGEHSLTYLFMDTLGINVGETSKPLHLLPSANLILNLSHSQDHPHSLKQWWRPNLKLHCNVYKY